MTNISSVSLIIAGVSDEVFEKLVALRALRQGEGRLGCDQVAGCVDAVLRAYEVELREKLNVGGTEALMLSGNYDPGRDLPALLHAVAHRAD